MNKKLDILLYAGLFSGLGVFSYLLLVSYSGFSPLVQEELYSFGACLFCILAFNILGYFTMAYQLVAERELRFEYPEKVEDCCDLPVGDVDVLFAELWFTGFG